MELEFILIFIHVKRNTNIHVYMLGGGGTEIISSELIKIVYYRRQISVVQTLHM